MYGQSTSVSGTKSRPFQEQWLDSCYQQTLLPDTPWHKVLFRVGRAFSERISKQFTNEERKQVILELLGPEFVKVYFPEEVQNPALLEPPNMATDKRNKLFREAQAWLQNQLNKAAKEEGCGRDQSEVDTVTEMKEFLQHTYNVFHTGLDRQLYKQEQELAAKEKEDLLLEKKEEKRKENLQTIALPPIGRTSSGLSTNSSVGSFADKLSVTNLKTSLHTLHRQNMPVIQGPASNLVGDAVVKILHRDPRRLEEIMIKLKGRQLPGTLRRYIWLDILLKNEREKMKESIVEKIVRERFGRTVAKHVGNMKLKRATQSPICGLIENAVIEMYENTTCMMPYYNESHMKEAARALNVLYVYDRSYEPYLIHWLFPLQLAFKQELSSDPLPAAGEHVYELAMYLDLLNTHCFPPFARVFNIADNVMSRLEMADADLHDHLKTIARKNNKVSQKDFLKHLIHKEKTRAKEMVEDADGSPRAELSPDEILKGPLIFVRKWVGEGFVTVLDTQALMFLWDQVFMQYWRQHVFEDFCLALLLLLKHKFFQATDYVSMKRVFLDEPCKLYTMDIQQAWEVLDNQEDVRVIPGMNRQNPKARKAVIKPVVPPTPTSRASIYGDTKVVPPIGLKDVGVKLVISSAAIKRDEALLNFDLRHLRLTVMAYFGTVHLDTRVSRTWAQPKGDVIPDKEGKKIYFGEYTKESFTFDNIDVTKYDLERELGGTPYAIVRVEYMKGRTPVPLGWSKVPLHTHKSEMDTTVTQFGSQLWHVVDQVNSYEIHPGDPPESLLPRTARIARPNLGYLGDGSLLTVRVVEVDPALRSKGRKTPKRGMTPAALGPDYIWVEHNKSATVDDAVPSSNEQPFDIYIDGVNFLPDNATIIKVTGRLVRTGQVTELPDILAYPELQTSGRHPRFKYRFHVNTDGRRMDVHAVLFLRVYTVDYNSKALVVIGSCLSRIFDRKGKLLVGGQQLKLKFGMPNLSSGLNSVTGTELDSSPAIPGTSILFRLLPHFIDYVKAPDYSSGYYKSVTSKPSPSEKRSMEVFNSDPLFPLTVDDMIDDLKREENDESVTEPLAWMADRLKNSTHLPANTPAGNLPWFQTLRYREDVGLKVKIERAYGIPEGLYLNCVGRVSVGIDSSEYVDQASLNHITTHSHDYDCLQKSPKWLDSPQTVSPAYDLNTVIVFTLYSLDAKYIPSKKHDVKGTLESKANKTFQKFPVSLTTVGWTVVPIFDSNAVYAGEHHLPIFKGEPNENLLKEMMQDDVEEVIGRQEWTNNNTIEAGGLVVKLWDSLYDEADLPPLDLRDELMTLVGDVTAYEEAENDTSGHAMTQLIVDSLEKKAQKDGTSGEVYSKERLFYEQVMSETYAQLLEEKLAADK